MVQDNKDGTYGVSYTPKEPGVYKVLVCVKEQHVQVSETCAHASQSSFPPWPSWVLSPSDMETFLIASAVERD